MPKEDFEKPGTFYLGRCFDPQAARPIDRPVLFPSKNLTTHAVCIGMTGSGKTGLCVGLVEEAALNGIPVLAIDPKGDLGNLLLTFDPLTPEAIAPWLEPGADAVETVQRMREGLAASGEDEARIGRLRAAADFAIYTPGSTAGLQLSIPSSLAAPPPDVLADEDLLRDRVGAAAAGLLGLVGVDADPVKSREYILIATLLDRAWRAGRDLDLAGLLQELQHPPIDRVGAIDLESFFPARDRFTLALTLNQILASPTFAAFREGEPLDVQRLLFTDAGRPRVSIVSLAHLGDAERMFVVTRLLQAVLVWMRAQSGTTSLRALLYMDEVVGFVPPVANPPSKAPLVTLLKQARAFGLGVVLATQNPIDLDYKGLSNTGTWFIGRLQTDRDQARVFDGLAGAAEGAGRAFDRARLQRLVAGLGSRVFLLHDIRGDEPVPFQTRFTLSYLRGPLTRDEVRRLMASRQPQRPAIAAPEAAPSTASAPQTRETAARPLVPAEVRQRFLPLAGGDAPESAVYEPCALASLAVRFFDAKLGVDHTVERLVAAPIGAGAIAVDWGAARDVDVALADLSGDPVSGVGFAALPSAAAQPKSYERWAKELAAWMQTTSTLQLLRSPSTGAVSRPDEREADFRARLANESLGGQGGEVEKLRARAAPKMAALDERIRRAQQAVEREGERARASKVDTAVSVGMELLGALVGGRRASSRSLATGARRAGRAVQESRDVERARDTLSALEAERAQLSQQTDAEAAALAAARDPRTERLEPLVVRPRKGDVQVRDVSLSWKPVVQHRA
jgi:hypothetical protein